MKTIYSADFIRKLIVKEIKAHPGHVSKQFDPPVDETPATVEKNWKSRGKNKYDIFGPGAVVWTFDCEPYDDQLRAEVLMRNGIPVGVTVQGE